MSFSKPKTPKPPPPAITGETAQIATGQRARMRRRMAGMFGRQSTILTGSQGATAPTNPTKTLLGG